MTQTELIRIHLARAVVRKPLRSAPFVSCGFCARTDVKDAIENNAEQLHDAGWRVVEEKLEDGTIRNKATYHLACDRCAPSHQEVVP